MFHCPCKVQPLQVAGHGLFCENCYFIDKMTALNSEVWLRRQPEPLNGSSLGLIPNLYNEPQGPARLGGLGFLRIL